MSRKILLGILLACCGSSGLLAADGPPRAGSAALIEKENIVDARLKGAPWKPAAVGTGLDIADRLRTGEFSRAAVRFTDLSVLRLDELTDIQILAPSSRAGKRTLDVPRGGAYFFSREKGNEMQIRTPAANGALRGTEFAVRVAASGRTTMMVYEGEVELGNARGKVLLKSGEQGEAEIGGVPRKTAVIDAKNIIQWCLYYPGVIDPSELPLTAQEKNRLSASLEAYRAGDLLGALAKSGGARGDGSNGVRLYRAAAMLSVGQVEKARAELRGTKADEPLRRALDEMIAAVQYRQWKSTAEPRTASEWMAESYHLQSRGKLDASLLAARKAVQQSPEFGFAWVRVAELLFSFGKTQDAAKALDRGLRLSPRNARARALRGFLFSAENRMREARSSFEEAIALDGALGDAWLGRGLTSFRAGREEEGRADLQTAATLEPNRSIFRSYLGKAFSETRNVAKANLDLGRARELDANDPTPWLYSAIQRKQENRYNEAVDDLERSMDLNDNRRIYRSRFLLDQDRAVRGTNLASIYLNNGMRSESVYEAVRAVNADYSSAAAHLFLSNSYDALRDPNRVLLRYETGWYNELLLSQLLSPVGGGSLSQFVSQQEYSKLFEKDGVGTSSIFEYRGTGQVREIASQYGTFGRFSYALDALYEYNRGVRLNNSFSNFEGNATIKLQLTPQDSLFFRMETVNLSTGDVLQRYDQRDVTGFTVQTLDANGNPTTIQVPNRGAQSFRQHERQDPGILLLGWHHEWSPGNHTLLLLGRLATRQEFTVNSANVPIITRDSSTVINADWPNEVGLSIPRDSALFSVLSPIVGQGGIITVGSGTFDLYQRTQFETHTAELQQIFTMGSNTLLLGGRYQRGTFETISRLSNYLNGARPDEISLFQDPPSDQISSVDFERINLYLYDTWKPAKWVTITGGVTYDSIAYPDNFRSPPLNDAQSKFEKVSPKAGIIIEPWKGAAIRAAYTEGVTGASFDQSVGLEPTQVAGFLQSYRTLASESLVGSVSGSRVRMSGVNFEQKLPGRIYLALGAERLDQRLDRSTGIFTDLDFIGTPLAILPSSFVERIRYREDILTASLTKLIGDRWSVGARYRFTRSDLHREIPELSAALTGLTPAFYDINSLAQNADTRMISGLHELNLFAVYNHPSGLFGRFEANYYRQSNASYSNSATFGDIDADGNAPAVISTSNNGAAGDNFWQFNAMVGYRFHRNQCEVSVGVLNLMNQDYNLSPVNPYDELARERTFVVRCKLNF